MPVTEAGRHLPGCKNTEFVWEFRKTRFCEGGRKQSCPLINANVGKAIALTCVSCRQVNHSDPFGTAWMEFTPELFP